MAKDTFTPIEMDKTRHLKFGINALIELEEHLGKPISELEDEVAIKDMRSIFWIGLKWEEKGLSEAQVGELMDETILKHEDGLQYLGDVLGKAIQKSLGQSGNTFQED